MNNHYKRRQRRLQIGGFILGLVLPFALFFGTGSSQKLLAAGPTTYPRNQALYVTALDGTKIAIDVWLPLNLSPKTKIPAIMRTTPYWRARDWVDKSLETDPTTAELSPLYKEDVDKFNKAGYAVVLVDQRGTGASFGNFPLYSSRNEIQDYDAVVNWIVAQHWSNRKVGSYGTSADGNTAEFLAVTKNPAVKAVVPRHIDFDPYAQTWIPGGLFAEYAQAKDNSAAVKFLNSNANGCGFPENESEPACQQYIQQTGNKGVKPVDADKDKRLLAAAVQQHASNFDIYAAAKQLKYRDDPFGPFSSFEDISLYNFKNDIDRSQVAIYSWASWLDAGTADGVLSHFMTLSNPQKAIIGAWSHGPYRQADPFLPPDTPLNPSQPEQLRDIINFFDTYLKDNQGQPRNLRREIKYYTLGEQKWKTTNVWPPVGVTNQTWYLAANGGLTTTYPTEKVGAQTSADAYTVNFEATTGQNTRWFQNFDALTYTDRAEEDQKLLTYTSAPLPSDMEITGHPVVTLYASSTAADGAFFVYLEDVDANGKVTYITEGELRPLHRKVSKQVPPYKIFGPYHSFKRKDAMPLVPGQVAELRFSLLPTSVLIKQGHRIRVAIAGHDKDSFDRYPAEGTPVISMQHNEFYASRINLPVMPRS